MNTAAIDSLDNNLATAALRTLVRVCPEIRTASPETLELVCAAMRAKSPAVIDELFDDGSAAPWMAEAIFASAVLSLAHEGIKVVRAA